MLGMGVHGFLHSRVNERQDCLAVGVVDPVPVAMKDVGGLLWRNDIGVGGSHPLNCRQVAQQVVSSASKVRLTK